jgi:non-canonical purine NTP pyrophosphatase (RdgB/HAM1 family)
MGQDARSTLVFISNNEAKLAEYREILNAPSLEMLHLPMEDLQHHNMEALARGKIQQILEFRLSRPFFVEHTGLAIEAWGELPGGLTGQFVTHFGCAGICAMLAAYGTEDRIATATTVIGYYDGKNIRIFPGKVSGRITSSPRGAFGFGWDSIFVPARSDKTYAEMTTAEKNQTSMRRIAAVAFADYLDLNPIDQTDAAPGTVSPQTVPARETPAKRHVFISYCRENRPAVAVLRDELRRAGEAVWWDEDIPPGQEWKHAIRSALRSSYAVILCLSAEAAARDRAGIYPELRDAIEMYREYPPGSVFIIPVRLSDCDIPLVEIDATRTLDGLQCVDLFQPDRRRGNLDRLISAVRSAPEYPLRARLGT